VKYSKKTIEVKLSASDLVVRNDSKTIPPTKLAKIFDRFYQVDKTANGTGLGLAIAKAVADKHRWQLTAKSENNVTEFRLRYK
jgi:signal transduction histidine kinase